VIATAQVAAAAALAFLTAAAAAWWHLGLLAISAAIVGNSIYAALHEAEHGILLPWRSWNDTLGVFLGLFFPAPFHLLRQGHLGHHYRNRSDDEAFDLYFAGDNPLWKWLQLYGILTGFFWLLIALSNVLLIVLPTTVLSRFFGIDRPSAACWNSFNPRYWRLIRCEAAMTIAFHALVIWTFQVPLVSYALVYFGFGFSWSAMQYVHHFGTQRDVMDGSRNLWLFKPIDVVWLNHNWHHTHHQQPTVSWIYLPKVSRQQDATREFLLWHYLRMWRGPRYTEEHVENRYAGRVIR
jgi:fatty acid desaturase